MDIAPGGFQGWEFEQKGYQERNVNNLLKILKTEEATETLTALAKTDKTTWISIRDTVSDLKMISGTDFDILGGVTDSIKDTITTQIASIMAPIKNEINSMINSLLAPFMPMIEAALNEVNTLISRGTGAIQAMLEGRFDEWLRELQLSLQGDVHAAQVERTEAQATLQFQTWEAMYAMGNTFAIPQWALNILNQYGSFAAYEAQADAGGIYSGQFDIDPDTIADILANLKLPDFTEEED